MIDDPSAQGRPEPVERFGVTFCVDRIRAIISAMGGSH
jgi:hypothetical protein